MESSEKLPGKKVLIRNSLPYLTAFEINSGNGTYIAQQNGPKFTEGPKETTSDPRRVSFC